LQDFYTSVCDQIKILNIAWPPQHKNLGGKGASVK
jgi:hypothetical protein